VVTNTALITSGDVTIKQQYLVAMGVATINQPAVAKATTETAGGKQSATIDWQ